MTSVAMFGNSILATYRHNYEIYHSGCQGLKPLPKQSILWLMECFPSLFSVQWTTVLSCNYHGKYMYSRLCFVVTLGNGGLSIATNSNTNMNVSLTEKSLARGIDYFSARKDTFSSARDLCFKTQSPGANLK